MTIDQNTINAIADALAKRIKGISPSDPRHAQIDAFVRAIAGFPPAKEGNEPYAGLVSKAAAESTPKTFDSNTPIDWRDFDAFITENFTVGEYLRYDSQRVPQSQSIKDAAVLICRELELIRKEWKGGIIITSGYRPPDVNAAMGGVSNSQHLAGHAVDIAPANGEIDRFQAWLDAQWAGALGYGARRGFVHLDMRNGKGFNPNDTDYGPRWDY
jgi:putative chitinase